MEISSTSQFFLQATKVRNYLELSLFSMFYATTPQFAAKLESSDFEAKTDEKC